MIAEAVVGLLLLASGMAALVAAIGLWRLPDFFMRMHAPAVCYTLGTWTIAIASVVHFSAGGGLALHSWLVVIILAITTPVTTVLLARAGLFRARQARDEVPPALGSGPTQGRPGPELE